MTDKPLYVVDVYLHDNGRMSYGVFPAVRTGKYGDLRAIEGAEPISLHPEVSAADAALDRYEAADRRRARHA